MADRFKEISHLKKSALPNSIQWFYDDDYFSDELFGVFQSEVFRFESACEEAYHLFEKATHKIIQENGLDYLGIPKYFHDAIEWSWQNRLEQPFLIGRFDINGGLDGEAAKIIEFNADTCTTLPETMVWQTLQCQKGGLNQFNQLKADLLGSLRNLKKSIPYEDTFFLASSFGYKEDILNCNAVLDIAAEAGFQTFYSDLEKIYFSEDGIFYPIGQEYQPVDVWFKIIPWDWIIFEEPNLAKELAHIITNKLCLVLNPPYTAIWQNKKFLSYITSNFPNSVIAETYIDNHRLTNYVEKPILGRLGENIRIMGNELESSKGDYPNMPRVYQQYYPLYKDDENYFYQIGMFYTSRPSAINVRAEQRKIITDNCEFMSHYIL